MSNLCVRHLIPSETLSDWQAVGLSYLQSDLGRSSDLFKVLQKSPGLSAFTGPTSPDTCW